jgi:protein gp37
MFSFITDKVNAVYGCNHGCYHGNCWANQVALKLQKQGMKKYNMGFTPSFDEKALDKKFKAGHFVFISDMGDLFGDWVPALWIDKTINMVRCSPEAKFLFLTKNPIRYFDFNFPDNCVLGATIETNRYYEGFSKAPRTLDRYLCMRDLDFKHKFISIEPIMDFDLTEFYTWIVSIGPEMVAIGYANLGPNELPEPQLVDTERLISKLSSVGIRIFRKTIREAKKRWALYKK